MIRCQKLTRFHAWLAADREDVRVEAKGMSRVLGSTELDGILRCWLLA